jgi:hypothetical protein
MHWLWTSFNSTLFTTPHPPTYNICRRPQWQTSIRCYEKRSLEAFCIIGSILALLIAKSAQAWRSVWEHCKALTVGSFMNSRQNPLFTLAMRNGSMSGQCIWIGLLFDCVQKCLRFVPWQQVCAHPESGSSSVLFRRKTGPKRATLQFTYTTIRRLFQTRDQCWISTTCARFVAIWSKQCKSELASAQLTA